MPGGSRQLGPSVREEKAGPETQCVVRVIPSERIVGVWRWAGDRG